MQVHLRSADPALFGERELLVALKTGGVLESPAAAAAKVLRCLARPDFGSEPVGDTRAP